MKTLMFCPLFLMAAFSFSFAQQVFNSTVENEGTDCSVTLPTSFNTANSKLPDPFKKIDGNRISSKEDWLCRRQEILKLAERTIYGTKPAKPANVSGTVSRTSIKVNIGNQSFTATVDCPNGNGPFPAVIVYGANDIANTIKALGVAVINYTPTALGGETGTSRTKSGVFFDVTGSNKTGTLAAWAWGISRIIDVIEADPNKLLDPTAIGVTGCSRYGKGPFAAGALDQRIALTIPIEGGTGGAAIMRGAAGESGAQSPSNAYGEQPWLGDDFSSFNSTTTVKNLPIDMHSVAGLIAPRGLLILEKPSAADWLASRSGHMSALAGSKIYEALGYGGNITYHSNNNNTVHCAWIPEWKTPVEDNVKRFLLRTQVPPVAPTMNPRSDRTFATADWIDWTTPTLSGTYSPGGGCEGFNISVSAAPAAGGSVTRSPEKGCYDAGTSVTLTAVPKEGWGFDGWDGDASGNTASASVTMNANKTATAKFKLTGDGTENLVKNGTFNGNTNWTLNQGTNYGGSAATWSQTGNKAAINITTAGAEKYQPQLIQTGIALEQGMKYRLTFKASAAAARTMEVLIQLSSSPYTSYVSKDFDLATAEQTYTLEFEMKAASDPNSQLAFNVGGNSTQNVTISDVKLIYIASLSDPDPSSSSTGTPSSSSQGITPVAIKVPLTHFSVRAMSGGALRIEANTQAVVEIFDIKGNKAASLNVSSGSQTVKLALPSGVYFAKARGMRNVMFVMR